MTETPWEGLKRHLDNDYAHMAVENVLRLVELGETAQDIRKYLVHVDDPWWAEE